ncbi:hypothetical protein QCA50_015521 [Cerrena zonata]|uniref:Uncharacterized protein n=1 Tax=Cerrena zonata TaxID=2478898 RepID=A0AAW0FT60_9APHY
MIRRRYGIHSTVKIPRTRSTNRRTPSRAQPYQYTADQHYAYAQQQFQMYPYPTGSTSRQSYGDASAGYSGYRASPLYSSVTASPGYDHEREEEYSQPPGSAGYGGRSPFSFDVDSGQGADGYNDYEGQQEGGEERERGGDLRFPSQLAVEAILGSSDFSRSLVPELQESKEEGDENEIYSSKGGASGTQRSSPPSQQPHAAITESNPHSTTMQSSSRPHTATTPGHHHHHPAHPGPISLPPPVTAFPIPPPHTLSPYHPHHPMSPYMSPLYHPAMMGMGMPGLTPHGLPPITPSMPSFTFLPQPSPMAPGSGYPPSSSAALGGEQIDGASSEERREREEEGDGKHSGGGSTMTATTDPRPRPPALPHIPPHQPPQPHPQFMASHPQLYSPYTPFSPGALWGRPGTGGNPYINPAVGAPVHSHIHSAGPMTPHHHHAPPHMQPHPGHIPPQFYAMRQPPSMSEDTGYFPPVPYAQQFAQANNQDGQQQPATAAATAATE